MGDSRIITTGNKNYMTIAVFVQNWRVLARKNCRAARQESTSQSATAYKFERYRALYEDKTNITHDYCITNFFM